MSRAARNPMLDHIMVYINGWVWSLAEMGDAADQRFDKGLQTLMDRGMMGPELQGKELFKSADVQFSVSGLEDRELRQQEPMRTAYEAFKLQEQTCMERSLEGTLCDDDKRLLMSLRTRYQALIKLAQP